MPAYAIVIIVVAIIAIIVVAVVILLRRRMQAADIYMTHGKFGTILVFNIEDDKGEPIRVLNVKGMYQSSTYLDDRYAELIFAYYKLYDHMFEADIPLDRVLMIGGGGYSYPKHFIASQPDGRIDVIEIDPKITRVAERYFFLDRLKEEYETDENGRLGLICGDGRKYLDELAAVLDGTAPAGALEAGRKKYGDTFGEPYDAILNDSFSGADPAPCLTTLEATRSIHACLTEGGMYLSNIVSGLKGERGSFMRAILATLTQVFNNVYVIPCGPDMLGDCDNNLVIATDATYYFTDTYDMEWGPDDPILTDEYNPVKELVAKGKYV